MVACGAGGRCRRGGCLHRAVRARPQAQGGRRIRLQRHQGGVTGYEGKERRDEPPRGRAYEHEDPRAPHARGRSLAVEQGAVHCDVRHPGGGPVAADEGVHGHRRRGRKQSAAFGHVLVQRRRELHHHRFVERVHVQRVECVPRHGQGWLGQCARHRRQLPPGGVQYPELKQPHLWQHPGEPCVWLAGLRHQARVP